MRKILSILIPAVILCQCSKPGTYDAFISVEDAPGGVYVFEFPLESTRDTYDFSFYTRVDGEWDRSIRLDVEWVSPEGASFPEKVYLRPDNPSGSVQLYRSGMKPVCAGQWKLSVHVPFAPEGFRGLGLICKANGPRQTS